MAPSAPTATAVAFLPGNGNAFRPGVAGDAGTSDTEACDDECCDPLNLDTPMVAAAITVIAMTAEMTTALRRHHGRDLGVERFELFPIGPRCGARPKSGCGWYWVAAELSTRSACCVDSLVANGG